MKRILSTERLILREMTEDDYDALAEILQDERVMYAYEHAFSDQEVRAWLANQLRRYREEKFGLWAVVRKSDLAFIGQCGLTLQDAGEAARVTEVGYLFRYDAWHRGYATEAAVACKEYAFSRGIPRVCSIIRDNNFASRRVAERNGMQPIRTIVKRYYGMEMPHIVYAVENR